MSTQPTAVQLGPRVDEHAEELITRYALAEVLRAAVQWVLREEEQ